MTQALTAEFRETQVLTKIYLAHVCNRVTFMPYSWVSISNSPNRVVKRAYLQCGNTGLCLDVQWNPVYTDPKRKQRYLMF